MQDQRFQHYPVTAAVAAPVISIVAVSDGHLGVKQEEEDAVGWGNPEEGTGAMPVRLGEYHDDGTVPGCPVSGDYPAQQGGRKQSDADGQSRVKEGSKSSLGAKAGRDAVQHRDAQGCEAATGVWRHRNRDRDVQEGFRILHFAQP